VTSVGITVERKDYPNRIQGVCDACGERTDALIIIRALCKTRRIRVCDWCAGGIVAELVGARPEPPPPPDSEVTFFKRWRWA
jgi:hypothetical protein